MQVGPQSAGAVPGPLAYGKGGTEPTTTDAALVLGYIDAERFLAGAMPLDIAGQPRGPAAADCRAAQHGQRHGGGRHF